MTTPTSEPTSIVAGDTVAWNKSFTDYPAGTWTLKYRLVKSGVSHTFTAGASGTDHAVAVTAATTAAWTAGTYDLTGWVESGSSRYTVYRGRLVVQPDLAAATSGYDARSTARQIYDSLVSGYQTRVTGGQGFVAEYSIAGRSMKFQSAADWIKSIGYWKTQVAAEEAAARLAAGENPHNRLLVRF